MQNFLSLCILEREKVLTEQNKVTQAPRTRPPRLQFLKSSYIFTHNLLNTAKSYFCL